MDIAEERRNRMCFLKRLYDLSGGDTEKRFDMFEVGRSVGLGPEDTGRVERYLKEEGLVEPGTFGPSIGITHRGVKEAETASANSEMHADHSLPINVLSIGQMVGSQIQQDSPSATQNSALAQLDCDALHKLAAGVLACLDRLDLPSQDKSSIQKQVHTIQSELASAEPNEGIIRKCLGSTKRILESMAGSLLASDILQQIHALLPS